jgi:hypothetical protein
MRSCEVCFSDVPHQDFWKLASAGCRLGIPHPDPVELCIFCAVDWLKERVARREVLECDACHSALAAPDVASLLSQFRRAWKRRVRAEALAAGIVLTTATAAAKLEEAVNGADLLFFSYGSVLADRECSGSGVGSSRDGRRPDPHGHIERRVSLPGRTTASRTIVALCPATSCSYTSGVVLLNPAAPEKCVCRCGCEFCSFCQLSVHFRCDCTKAMAVQRRWVAWLEADRETYLRVSFGVPRCPRRFLGVLFVSCGMQRVSTLNAEFLRQLEEYRGMKSRFDEGTRAAIAAHKELLEAEDWKVSSSHSFCHMSDIEASSGHFTELFL